MTSIRMKLVGEAMKEQRNRAGKTMEQVGDAIGVKRATISAWENGKNSPAVDSIAAYCDYLGVDYLDLATKTKNRTFVSLMALH